MNRWQKQEEILAAIVTTARTVSTIGRVIDERVWLDSTHDVLEISETNPDGGNEIAYLLIELLGYEDEDSGRDDCPRFFLDYSLRLFRQRRSDRSSSRDFNRSLMELGQRFLGRHVLNTHGATETENERLIVSTDAEHGQVDSITGVVGHAIEWSLRIETVCDCS